MPIPGSLLLIPLVLVTTTRSEPAAIVVPESCPVTRPTAQPFTPPTQYPAVAPDANRFWYGSSALWVMPKTDGTWRGLRTESGYSDKLFVWREGYSGHTEPRPRLTVTGKPLDGEGPPANISRATSAYHRDFGGWAMLVGVVIPTPGCWQLSASYGDDTLAFVVWVVP